MITKVLIVEDDPMAQKLLSTFVDAFDRYCVIGTLKSAGFAPAFVTQNQTDLILMDVCTDLGVSGLEKAIQIKKERPEIKIIIITSQPEYDLIDRAKAGQVDSFWYKTSSESELLQLMDQTMSGENIYPDSTPNLQIGYAWSYDFTSRQLDVLRELISGDTNAEIGKRLGLSASTVRDHIQVMLEMTGLSSRTSLAVAAFKSGLVKGN